MHTKVARHECLHVDCDMAILNVSMASSLDNATKTIGLQHALFQYYLQCVGRLMCRADSCMLMEKARELRAVLLHDKSGLWTEKNLQIHEQCRSSMVPALAEQSRNHEKSVRHTLGVQPSEHTKRPWHTLEF